MAEQKLKLYIEVDASQAPKLLDIASKIERVDEATDKAGKTANMSLTDFKSGLDMVASAARQLQQVVSQALDFAQLGARVQETENSFARLREEHGLDIEYFNRVRNALNGTVNDMEIMSGVNVVTAGTTHEFGSALVDAYPQLAEFAKAASKLNPSLGDTSYMLQSITTGLKRNSPLILDNLGITVKLGEAHEKYAESIGKTAESLSVEEQQQALLNGVLEAGNRLIEQAGGTTEALTDNIEQLTVAQENYKNEASKAWSNYVSEIGLAKIVTDELIRSTNQMTFTRLYKEAEELGISLEDIDEKANVVATRGFKGAGVSAEELTEIISDLNGLLEDHADALAIVNAEQREFSVREREAEERARLQAEAAKEAKEDLDEYAQSLREAALAQSERLDTSWFGDSLYWSKALEAAENARLDRIKQQRSEQAAAYESMQQDIRDHIAAQGDEFKALLQNKDGLDELMTSTKTGEEAEKTLAKALMEAADAAGAGAGSMAMLALATGDYDEEAVSAALKAAALKGKIDELGIRIAQGLSTKTALEELRTYYDELQNPPEVPAIPRPAFDPLSRMDRGEEPTPIEIDTTDAEDDLDNLQARLEETTIMIGDIPSSVNVAATDNFPEMEGRADKVIEKLKKIRDGKWTAHVDVEYDFNFHQQP